MIPASGFSVHQHANGGAEQALLAGAECAGTNRRIRRHPMFETARESLDDAVIAQSIR
jgi:hypothetical protein